MQYDTIAVTEDAGLGTVTLNRPEVLNALNTQMRAELLHALRDLAPRVRALALTGAGRAFCSGQDLGDRANPAGIDLERTLHDEYEPLLRLIHDSDVPVIAAVNGKVIAGGLMLVWPCDIIVAADDAEFTDNTVAMGVCGAEFFHHPWEVGMRKAKEMLFTSDTVTAADALALGMVNHVVTRADLTEFTMALARRIAAMPLFALKLAKEAVNAAQDAQGRSQAMATSFALHQLAHSHNMQRFGMPIDPSYFERADGQAVRRRP